MSKLSIRFVTTNKAKFTQVRALLAGFSIEVEQCPIELVEPNFKTLKEIAEFKAQQAFSHVNQPVIVDDSGFFFEAFPNFPGVRSAWVYETLGYTGLMALLAGRTRQAYAQTAACYTSNGKDFHVFTGTLKGTISEIPTDQEPLNPRMPYKDIFYPVGQEDNLNDMDPKILQKINHRDLAFKELAHFLLSL
jgi:XTP/dITP diphosphohydrolase